MWTVEESDAGARARAAPRLQKKVDAAIYREDALSQRREARSSRRCRAGAGETHDDLSRSSHCTGTTAVALKKSHNVKVVDSLEYRRTRHVFF